MQDSLKAPIEVRFKGEPAIDEGGVRKEFFHLITNQLFSPAFGMFEENDDTNLFWFKRKTMEFPINYELLGTIVGIAFYNNL